MVLHTSLHVTLGRTPIYGPYWSVGCIRFATNQVHNKPLYTNKHPRLCLGFASLSTFHCFMSCIFSVFWIGPAFPVFALTQLSHTIRHCTVPVQKGVEHRLNCKSGLNLKPSPQTWRLLKRFSFCAFWCWKFAHMFCEHLFHLNSGMLFCLPARKASETVNLEGTSQGKFQETPAKDLG